jgi:hypothetical protein
MIIPVMYAKSIHLKMTLTDEDYTECVIVIKADLKEIKSMLIDAAKKLGIDVPLLQPPPNVPAQIPNKSADIESSQSTLRHRIGFKTT